MTMTQTNPLLLQEPIEKIDCIEPDYVVPAISSIIEDNLKVISDLQQQEAPTWESLMWPLEAIDNRLHKAWSPVSHLNSVCNSEALRAAYEKALAKLTDYSTQIGQNQALYQSMKRLAESAESLQLSAQHRYLLTHELQGFELSGVALPEAERKRFADNQQKLAELSTRFEQNLLDATMAWQKHILDKSALAGLPEDELAMLAANAKNKGLEGYLLTLEIPSYLAVITYAEDRALREEIYTAYVTRASDQGPDAGKFDNSEIMQELLRRKQDKASMLGFANYAELSLATKMAQSPDEVLSFLGELATKSKPQAEREFAELKAFAAEQGVADLQAWDVAYFSEKLKQKRFSISQSELKPYFPLPKVLEGLFKLVETIFDIEVKPVSDVAVWHPDVSCYAIYENEEEIARFYLDLFARPHKRGGAWMDDYCSRFVSEQGLQKPVAFLTCNFAPPVDGKPSLLTHDDVLTLFHEFGHGLHHMLTKVDELSAAGINNVPWDAVELPSQFMENFCYEQEVLAFISGHFETGEPLPEEKLRQLIAARNFQSAMMMVRQLEFALFDMRIHLEQGLDIADIQRILNEVRDEVAVVRPPEFNRFQHGFSHIFGGGYAAGYYSYKWAEVLSADAYSLFEEKGVLSKEAGQSFKKWILQRGGSADPMQLFTAFRGRKPSLEPLLRHSGITTESN